MGRWAVAAFARRFREAIERDGIAALERFDWAGGFSELGFEMDCGRSSEEAYGLGIGDAGGIGGLARVDDVVVLGNAVFSQCRYLVHWGCGGGEGACYWLVAALARMEELAGAAPRVACVYRFEDAVEEAVAGFCGREGAACVRGVPRA